MIDMNYQSVLKQNIVKQKLVVNLCLNVRSHEEGGGEGFFQGEFVIGLWKLNLPKHKQTELITTRALFYHFICVWSLVEIFAKEVVGVNQNSRKKIKGKWTNSKNVTW